MSLTLPVGGEQASGSTTDMTTQPNPSVVQPRFELGKSAQMTGSGNIITRNSSGNVVNFIDKQIVISGIGPSIHQLLDDLDDDNGSIKSTSTINQAESSHTPSAVTVQGDENSDIVGALPRIKDQAASRRREKRKQESNTYTRNPDTLSLRTNGSRPTSPVGYAQSTRSHRTARNKRVVPPSQLVSLTASDLKLPDLIHDDIKAYMHARLNSTILGSKPTICLWDPYPDNQRLREKYCILGDVGVFNSRGGFDVHFNIFMTMEENHAMNYNPPASFLPLQVDKQFLENDWKRPPIDSDCYASENINIEFIYQKGESAIVAYRFTALKEPLHPGGAILVLPNGCSLQRIPTAFNPSLEKYLDQQAESWYDPANYSNEQRALSNGSLKLIHACYQSKTWAAAILPKRKYVPNTPHAELKRSPKNPNFYHWHDYRRECFFVNSGSFKENFVNPTCTIAVEVYSVMHRGPELKISSSVYQKTPGFSLRATLSRIRNKLSISPHPVNR